MLFMREYPGLPDFMIAQRVFKGFNQHESDTQNKITVLPHVSKKGHNTRALVVDSLLRKNLSPLITQKTF